MNDWHADFLARQIVRDLAGEAVPTARDRDEISEWCVLCGAEHPDVPIAPYQVALERGKAVAADLTWHEPDCLWRRAREWVEAHT